MGYEGTGTNALNANFLAAMRESSVELEVRVGIEPNSAAAPFYAVSGPRRLFGHPNVVESVTPVRAQWDERDRRFRPGKCTVGFSTHGFLRGITKDYLLLGSMVTIYVGTPDLAEADWEPMFVGVVADPTALTNLSRLEVGGPEAILKHTKITGEFVGAHPAEQVLEIITRAGLTSDWYDATSLDVTTSQWSGFSHLGCARTNPAVTGNTGTWWKDRSYTEPTPALEVVQELLQVMDASLIPNLRGKLYARKVDRTASVLRTLTKDDILDFEHQSSFDNLENRSTLNFDMDGRPYSDWAGRFDTFTPGHTAEDQAAQAQVAFAGGPDRVVQPNGEVTNNWLNGVGWCRKIINEAETGIPASGPPFYIDVYGSPARYGFSGSVLQPARRVYNTFVDSAHQASASRPAYLMLTNGLGVEIVEADLSDVSWASGYTTDPNGHQWPLVTQYRVQNRELDGSTTRWDNILIGAIAPLFVWDITPCVYSAEPRVSWLSKGAPRIRVRVRHGHMDLMHGDVVAVEEDVFFARGLDGLGSDVAFVITGIQNDPKGDRPGLWLDLVWIRSDVVVPVTIDVVGGGKAPSLPKPNSDATARILGLQQFDFSDSGLDITLTAGGAEWGGMQSGHIREGDFTLRPTMDHWVYADALQGAILVIPQTIGNPEPETESWWVPLWKFTTDATTVTASTDRRPTHGLVHTLDQAYDSETGTPTIDADHGPVTIDTGGIGTPSLDVEGYVAFQGGETVVGQGTHTTIGTNATLVGAGTRGEPSAAVVGYAARTTGANAAVLGAQGVAHASGISLGRLAATTKANEMAVGSPSYYVDEVAIGAGPLDTTARSLLLRASDGNGTDVAGWNLELGAGVGTGTGKGGELDLSTAEPGGSTGSAKNTRFSMLHAEAHASGIGPHIALKTGSGDQPAHLATGAPETSGASGVLVSMDLSGLGDVSGVAWASIVMENKTTGDRNTWQLAAKFDVTSGAVTVHTAAASQVVHSDEDEAEVNAWIDDDGASGGTLEVQYERTSGADDLKWSVVLWFTHTA